MNQIGGTLFAWPKQAEFGRKLNKELFYAGARNNRKLKQLFTDQVARVVWKYKLASSTLNTPATVDVPEIEVIQIDVSGADLDPAILMAIDKTIPNPTIHEIHSAGRVKQSAAYKRASESDANAWVISHYLTSDWQSADATRTPLPTALNLGILYASLLRTMIDIQPLDGEPLRAHVERHGQVLQLRRDAERISQKMNAEKQLNRKVEWNSQLRSINQEIQKLTSTPSQESNA